MRRWTVKLVAGTLLALAGIATHTLDFIPVVPGLPQGLTPAVLGLAAVALIAWAFIDLKGEVKRLREEAKRLHELRPTITVEPVREGTTYSLKVTNHGGLAAFTAQIALKYDDPDMSEPTWSRPLAGLWDSPEGSRVEIAEGGNAILRIAETRVASLGVAMESLNILYYETAGSQDHTSGSSQVTGAKVVSAGRLARAVKPNGEFHLLVTISSHPGLREGVFRREYRLDFSRLSEHSSKAGGKGS